MLRRDQMKRQRKSQLGDGAQEEQNMCKSQEPSCEVDHYSRIPLDGKNQRKEFLDSCDVLGISYVRRLANVCSALRILLYARGE